MAEACSEEMLVRGGSECKNGASWRTVSCVAQNALIQFGGNGPRAAQAKRV